MCEVRKKLILFDYAISKFAEKVKEQKNVTINTALEEFSTTQVMKLMYLTSLQCEPVVAADGSKITPFSILDNWIAFPNGPVEYDVYRSLSFMPTIQKYVGEKYKERVYDDEEKKMIETFYLCKKTIKFDNRESVRNSLIEYYPDLNPLIIEIGKNINDIWDKYKDIMFNVNALIRISHSGILWAKAQLNDDRKMRVNDIYLLNREKKEINKYTPIYAYSYA